MIQLKLNEKCDRCSTWATDVRVTPEENVLCEKCNDALIARTERDLI